MVEMLTKHPPYHELEPMAALFKIAQEKKAKYTLDDRVSTTARAFIERIFVEESCRPSAYELLEDDFVTSGYS